jgi:hypothetical protein
MGHAARSACHNVRGRCARAAVPYAVPPGASAPVTGGAAVPTRSYPRGGVYPPTPAGEHCPIHCRWSLLPVPQVAARPLLLLHGARGCCCYPAGPHMVKG